MLSRTQTRLECLKLANAVACGKSISPKDVIPTAMEYFKWVDDDPSDQADTTKLTERFKVAR